MSKLHLGFAILGCALLLTGCQPAPPEPQVIRPVLTRTLAPQGAAISRFAGEIAPRFQTDLSFRVFGRVIDSSVDVGDYVVEGQQIAQLDATSQQLAVRSAEANVSSAQAQLNNLLAVEERQRSLLELNNISREAFESAEQASRAAEAAVAQAQAQLDKANEQLGYTTLRTDTAGLVTAVSIEPGQTVIVGQAVATVVRPETREAVLSVLEGAAGNLKVGDKFFVARQLDPSNSVPGEIREIAPQADPTTRTVTVKISLVDPVDFKLGSTILATRSEAAAEQLTLPASAILQEGDSSFVWVVDPATELVTKRAVELEARDAQTVLAASGVSAGEVIVIAGVNSLKAGQQVRIQGSVE